MGKIVAIAMAIVILSACGQQDSAKPATAYDFSKDAYTWLEEVEGEEALAWVEEQNAASLGYLESLPVYEPLRERNLEIYNSDERIATPAMRGDHVYNFWRDEDNVRGRWRRMLLDDYVDGGDEWELVLDLDKLAEGEDEDWVWKGAQCLRPEYRRCLLSLSRGGADAVVVREFDVVTRTFVMDGFSIPEAKHRVSWIDSNAVWVGSDFGDGSLTDSGYPRTARLWRRGEPLEEATEVFAGEQADVSAGVYRAWDRDVCLLRWTLEALVFGLNARGGLEPEAFQTRLPKSFIHRVVPGDPVHGFVSDWLAATEATRGHAVWGPRAWFVAAGQEIQL